MQKWQELWHSDKIQQQGVKKIWVSRRLLASWLKTYINRFRQVVVVWVQKSGTVFCEYTLRRRIHVGDRLKEGWRVVVVNVYRGALSAKCCASRAVACVPRFKTWSRTACLEQQKESKVMTKKQGYSHQWAATLRWSDPFQPKDFCLVILNLRPQIVLNCGFSWFSGLWWVSLPNS